ncbi:hypothetical protein DNTS_006529 [Danionella cerebrum]|uniref:BZIP domain-containing protein n=1 Tax=Danionella cerebrum TaxID=2873325 RepID=A0A553Q213_9TELE|nr:hypothetical protein DNTS_006529 [Danionella translucida]
MMTMSAPIWKTLLVCPADPLTLSHPQANHSQSEGCRGEGPEENQHLIGDGLSDWMTEEVDFSSYLPTPHSSPTPNSSLPPSPLQHDIQVPSDLEVMTSLLQEELAQLEDYFLSDPLPEKSSKLGKCEKGPTAVGPPSYYQLPYAAYSTSNQSESSPLLVTLATGELDLLSFCGGGPIGRTKIPRHAPYSCSRPNSNICTRKRVSDGVRPGDGYESSIWSSKGNPSGNSAVAPTGAYSCAEDERVVGKGYCLGSKVEIRRCSILPKDEKNCHYTEEAIGTNKATSGYNFNGQIQIPHKKDEMMMFGIREVNLSGIGGSTEMELMSEEKNCASDIKTNAPWKIESNESCFLQSPSQDEAYHNFLGAMSDPVKVENLEIQRQHNFHCGFLDSQGPDCLNGDSDGAEMGSPCARSVCGRSDLEVPLMEGNHGERKQKKRDQNKTAAHRYRQRKRAELDSLEEQLHGLEGRNRELRDKAESVEREIQYVKDLLIEVYKARSQRLKQETSA